jgi:hypothetical protein
MKANLKSLIIRLTLILLSVFTFSSCVVTETSYSRSYYDEPEYERPYYGDPYYGNRGYGYGRGYYDHHTTVVVCRSCGYNPCRCGHRSSYSHRGHDHSYNHGRRHYDRDDNDSLRRAYRDKISSRSSESRSQEKIRLTDYNQKKSHGNLPDGYHSREWFEKRGYDLKKNSYKNQDGKHYGAGSDRKNSKRR